MNRVVQLLEHDLEYLTEQHSRLHKLKLGDRYDVMPQVDVQLDKIHTAYKEVDQALSALYAAGMIE